MATTKEEPTTLWTAEDVARMLHCDPRTVRRKTKTDGLPFIQTAKNRILFNPADVNRWLAMRTTTIKPTASQPPVAEPAFPAWDGVKRTGRRRV